ncbi:MAG: tetratricopeptide repeat protein [Crocinitomicaceae bacterium]
MKKYLLFLFAFQFALISFAQDGGSDQQLAQYYYDNGEYDKALVYYDKLFDQNPSKINFTRYVECLVETGESKKAEKTFKRFISNQQYKQEYQILFAKFYENQGEPEKANSIYRDLVDNLEGRASEVVKLYNAFKAQNKPDLAFETLQKGRKLLKKSYPLNYYFADYYGSVNETEKMIDEYLNLLEVHRSYINDVQRVLSRQIDFSEENSEEYELLKVALLERSQKNPSNTTYAEMLTWLFIQRQNFAAAFVHVKALDKRMDGRGQYVFNLGAICVENKDFTTAKKCFEYLIIGKDELYAIRAQNALLNVRFLQVTTQRNFTSAELNETITAYEEALERVGTNSSSLPLVLELTHIQAFYANNSKEAVTTLTNALDIPGISLMQKSEVKMQLADIHVLDGDIWEAALLYSQVDKDYKFEAIGHEAKFKNARIFYYDGEFDYAQSQLDVLKQATTKLIANDALNLSLMITDNYGLDSNYIAMNWFAQADLLIEQHQYDRAFTYLDSITDEYPAHSLGDEILMKKSRSYQLRGEWNKAVESLEELLKYYPTDILADDALFQLGDIYESNLLNPDKAKDFYRRILFDHKGSLYTTEARKRFQKLRGEGSLLD